MARHRLGVGAAIAAVAALIAVGAILWQAQVARRERELSQRRFEQVRSLARAVMWDLHDKIAPLPGSTEARKVLVERALTYLAALAQEAGSDPGLQIEVADGYLRLGRVQGDFGIASLGETTAALATFAKARDTLLSLLAQGPGHLRAKRLLVEVLRRTAYLHKARGERHVALQFAEEGRRTLGRAGATVSSERRSATRPRHELFCPCEVR